MIDERIVSELQVILSEYQMLDIRLANVVEFLRQEQSKAIENPKEATVYPERQE